MTARQIRRAVERKARKQARKETNRANAQFSTGPKTQEGKQVTSMNALKTALTGRTVLLPTDDAERYRRHLTDHFHRWNPAGEQECALVQALADTWWRLLRIPVLEEALYAKGRALLADRVADVDPASQPAMLQLEAYLLFETQFRNLALQERRLSNYAARLLAELEQAQRQRLENEPALYQRGEGSNNQPQDTESEAPGAEFGFEFSTAGFAHEAPRPSEAQPPESGHNNSFTLPETPQHALPA